MPKGLGFFFSPYASTFWFSRQIKVLCLLICRWQAQAAIGEMAGESSPSLSPLQLVTSVLLRWRQVRRGGLVGFWHQRGQSQKHKARSAAGAGMQQLCGARRRSWFNTLSVLWSLGENRGSQSLWVMDTLLIKMGMLQGLSAWDPAASATAEPGEAAGYRKERTRGLLSLYLYLMDKTQGWYLGHVVFPQTFRIWLMVVFKW